MSIDGWMAQATDALICRSGTALRYLKRDMLLVLAGGLLAWGGGAYLEAVIGKP